MAPQCVDQRCCCRAKDVRGRKLEVPVSTGTHYVVKISSHGGNWIKRCQSPGLMGKKGL